MLRDCYHSFLLTRVTAYLDLFLDETGYHHMAFCDHWFLIKTFSIEKNWNMKS